MAKIIQYYILKTNKYKSLVIFYAITNSFYPKRQKRLGFLLKGFETLIEKAVWFKLYFSFSP